MCTSLESPALETGQSPDLGVTLGDLTLLWTDEVGGGPFYLNPTGTVSYT